MFGGMCVNVSVMLKWIIGKSVVQSQSTVSDMTISLILFPGRDSSLCSVPLGHLFKLALDGLLWTTALSSAPFHNVLKGTWVPLGSFLGAEQKRNVSHQFTETRYSRHWTSCIPALRSCCISSTLTSKSLKPLGIVCMLLLFIFGQTKVVQIMVETINTWVKKKKKKQDKYLNKNKQNCHFWKCPCWGLLFSWSFLLGWLKSSSKQTLTRSTFLVFVLWIASERHFRLCLLACWGQPMKKDMILSCL